MVCVVPFAVELSCGLLSAFMTVKIASSQGVEFITHKKSIFSSDGCSEDDAIAGICMKF